MVEGACPVCLVYGEWAQTSEVRHTQLVRDYRLTSSALDVRSHLQSPVFAADSKSTFQRRLGMF